MKNSSKGPSPSELAVQSTYKAPVVLTKHRTIPSQVHTTTNHVTLNHAPPSSRPSRQPIRSSTGPTKRTKTNIHSNVGQEANQKRIKLNHDTNDYDKNDTITNTTTSNNNTKNDDNDPKKRLTNDWTMETAPNDESHPQEQDQEEQQSHVNAYDSMLGEIHDLLMAAQEAQSLGRLRMASTYQMLAHTRLIGLGKRFDRCLIRPENQPSFPLSNHMNMLPLDDTSSAINHPPNATEDLLLSESSTTHPMLTSPTKNTHGTIQTIQHRSDAQAALAKMLPSNVNVDDTMMEHLARAAMELHNKRTGRGMQSERITSFQQTIPQQGTFMEHVTSFLSNTTATSTASTATTATATATTNASGTSQTKNRLLLKKSMHPYPQDHQDNGDDDDDDNDDDNDDDEDENDNVPTTTNKDEDKDDKHKEDDEEGKGHEHDGSSPDRQKRKRGKSQPKAMLTVATSSFDAKKMLTKSML